MSSRVHRDTIVLYLAFALILVPAGIEAGVMLSVTENMDVAGVVRAAVVGMFLAPVFLVGFALGVFVLVWSTPPTSARLWLLRLVILAASVLPLAVVALDYPFRSPLDVRVGDLALVALALTGISAVVASLLSARKARVLESFQGAEPKGDR